VSVRYLLDSDILSEPVRPRPNQRLISRLRAHRHEIATASTVWHELRFGLELMANSKRRKTVEKYLVEVVGPLIPILPYGVEAAVWHARERARLVKAGRTPPHLDAQIAAVAAVNDLTLVTGNTSDYEGFNDLVVENWFR